MKPRAAKLPLIAMATLVAIGCGSPGVPLPPSLEPGAASDRSACPRARATPSIFSISGNGGTGTFGVGTGTSCQWSAVSQASWLTITSGSSGTAAGNVAFSVAANPVTIPRTGTIQAGNGSATATFTVTEVGACTYSLSTSQIAIQPGGGTYTVSVNTPKWVRVVGCS